MKQHFPGSGVQANRGRPTLSERVWPHELIPVQREVLVLVIIFQQLPQVLLSSQDLQ